MEELRNRPGQIRLRAIEHRHGRKLALATLSRLVRDNRPEQHAERASRR